MSKNSCSHKMRNNIFLLIILSTINMCLWANQHQADNNEPIVITADSFTLDYANGYAVYTNNVAVNRANKQLTSDNLFIYFNNAGTESAKFKSIVATSNKNHIVRFTDNNLLATSGIIKYEPSADGNKITLEKNAIIEQNNKKLISELLYYDLKKEVAYMPKINNQRSKIILG